MRRWDVLEDLASHGQVMLATLGMQMRAVEKVSTRLLHNDTTAFTLFGDYSVAAGPTAPIQTTYGHSKDHRPDLRQIMARLMVDEDG